MTQGPFDPLVLWRDMLAKWEAGFNELAGKNMTPPEFMAGLMGQYLTAMNMPSRADLVALDERLRRIEDQLAQIAARTGPSAGVPHEGKGSRTGRDAPAISTNGPAAEAHTSASGTSGKPPPRAGKKKRGS